MSNCIVSLTDVYSTIEAHPNSMNAICALIKMTPAELLMGSVKHDLNDASCESSIYATALLKQYVRGLNLTSDVISKYPRALITAALDVYCTAFENSNKKVEWEKMLCGLLKLGKEHSDIVRNYVKHLAKSGGKDFTDGQKIARMTFLAEYI